MTNREFELKPDFYALVQTLLNEAYDQGYTDAMVQSNVKRALAKERADAAAEALHRWHEQAAQSEPAQAEPVIDDMMTEFSSRAYSHRTAPQQEQK